VFAVLIENFLTNTTEDNYNFSLRYSNWYHIRHVSNNKTNVTKLNSDFGFLLQSNVKINPTLTCVIIKVECMPSILITETK